MLKLEEIRKNAAVAGVEPGLIVRVVTTEPVGPDALTIYYKTADGALRERMLFRSDESNLTLAEAGRPWAFDAPGEAFKLAAEAYRINLAHLFDPMMAVHTSNVEPLPHQITAVYESMLPRQPLRYVLADDPGAGKTIMAGLLIRELLMRADARRVLIVAPGSLVEQWQDEMAEKFGLEFTLFSREMVEQSRGNAFEDADLMVARVDQLSRSEELLEKLRLSRWDLVVVDEAHKLSASYFGNKVQKTKRFQLGELLGGITRHLLLMTATPHNGKEEDFQLFMSLLDSDRFYGKFRDGAHQVDVTDLMRRMVKEDLLKFDGSPLFPERIASTVNYKLSDLEAALYEAVTSYVKEEMNRADQLQDGNRKGTVGFALTSLQRRLASSPEAIYQSLKRRRIKLSRRVEEEKLRARGQASGIKLAETMPSNGKQGSPEDVWESADALTPDDYEEFEEAVVDQATAAQTIVELEAEIFSLQALEEQARQVVHSGQDRKWDELSRLLQDTPEMRDADGRQRKLIIFTEHKDTLNYLADKIRGLIGTEASVVMIHGGVKREDRRKVQELFRNDPATRVLLATDAAGEGVNLQNANLMVNYDLPWNPNRLEQRFGRIHRIGQTEVCHLWNMVAKETREGDVFQRLFEKIEIERAALKGRVFDILGEVFEERSLKDLLIDAIRYGDDPEVRARLHRQVDGALDTAHLETIIKRNALCDEVMDSNRLFALKEEMEKAEARKLQPYFIRAFFSHALQQLGGELRAREAGRWEITNVPAMIRERDRQIAGRDRRHLQPVLRRYERVCFEKKHVRLAGKVGAPMASLIHPAHPLMQATTDLMLEQHRSKLKQGAVLVDPTDLGLTPRLLFMVDHAVREGEDQAKIASRRMQFVAIDPQGRATNAGWAPHLDMQAADEADLALVPDVLAAPWIARDLEQVALTYASAQLVPEHFNEVRTRREAQVDKTLAAVHERLVKEINYWSDRYIKLGEDRAAGKDVRLPLENVQRTIDDLTARKQSREKELLAQRHVVSSTPVVVGGALVVPAGLLMQRRGLPAEAGGWTADAEARSRVEQLAMQAVMDAERALGHQVIDVSAQKCGWDITAIPPARDGKLPLSRHIEVKGRAKGSSTVTVTKNEVLYGLNQQEKFILAVVLISQDTAEPPIYIRSPFQSEPDWAATSINLDLDLLLSRGVDRTRMTQKYFGCRIADLLPRVNSDILIPSIQRPYVWEPEQIVKLFDSLLRGYPINTFLLWHLEPSHFGDLEIYRFVKNFRQGDVHNDPASVDGDKPLTLVLDGQQRLTSLLIGLEGSYTVRNGVRGRGAGWVEKVLMINLVQSPDAQSEEDDDGFTVRELYYGLKFFSVDRLPKNDKSAVWFKVPGIVGVRDRDQLAATVSKLLLLNPDLSVEAQRTLMANLERLWTVVHEEECLAYYLEREQSYDKVLDIFVRANDGGTKLSRSDLLMSMVTLRWDQFNARSETEAITYKLRDMLQHESAFDRDYLLRSGLFFNDLDFAFQLRNFTPRNIALIESRWQAVKQALLIAGDMFKRFGIVGGSLTGVNAVMLIGCYVFKRNAGVPLEEWAVSEADADRVRRWITCVLFHGVLGGAANITMEFYRRVLNERIKESTDFPIEELTARMAVRGRTMSFDAEAMGRFAALDTKHRIFGVSLASLYDRQDWTVKNWQHVQVIPSHRLLDDRLRVQGVPPEEIPAYQSWAHRMANHIILSDAEASEYYSMELEDWAATRTPDFWRRHHLPDDPSLYEEFNFLAFIEARKRALLPVLQALLNDDRTDSASIDAVRPTERIEQSERTPEVGITL